MFFGRFSAEKRGVIAVSSVSFAFFPGKTAYFVCHVFFSPKKRPSQTQIAPPLGGEGGSCAPPGGGRGGDMTLMTPHDTVCSVITFFCSHLLTGNFVFNSSHSFLCHVRFTVVLVGPRGRPRGSIGFVFSWRRCGRADGPWRSFQRSRSRGFRGSPFRFLTSSFRRRGLKWGSYSATNPPNS